MASLTKTNSSLTTHATNPDKQIKNKDSEIETMCKSINELTAALQGLQHGPDASAGLSTSNKT
eukprot:10975442-Ditylum_brightwellii.AAC.1